MTIALVSLSNAGAILADRVHRALPNSKVYLHENVDGKWDAERFDSIVELTQRIFAKYTALVYMVPCGVVVRALSPNLKSKTQDPAVVVVDVGARWAISLLSGHEGGANELAVDIGNILAAEPVISTTTEALKTVIVGIGCRRGTKPEKIVAAIQAGLKEADFKLSQVRLLSSASVKADEEGLLAAARELVIPLRFIDADEIRNSLREFDRSHFVEEKVNLPAVAEPCALLAGRRTRLVLPKRSYNGITIAVAEEG
ncbi:MAG: cobalamin biosynthesis protein [Desulfomonilaceae bacterium]